jgi:hypothetical protein
MLPGCLSEVIQNAIAIDSNQIPYLQLKFADSGLSNLLFTNRWAWFEQFGLLSNIFKPVVLNPVV